MKVMTVLGTRPEIIRLSRVIPLLDQHVEHVLVFTGQNFDPNLSDRFFHELEVRSPDYRLECRADTPVGQIAAILTGCEAAISAEKPERLLILGDTNSGLSAIVAKRKGVQVFHMEAGNRCYDDRVPEEVNRRIIDHSSDVLMPYTERSRQNLLREGIAGERIYVTGNPIYEVIQHFVPRIAESAALEELGLETGRYFLVTMHREENVDVPPRLESLIRALMILREKFRVPVVVSTHPRTRKRMAEFGILQDNPMIRFLQPFGFFDFIHLERNAFCVLSDSGTVQEECCIFKVPNVTLRDVTERPETVEVGSNVLSGVEPESILRCVDTALSHGCNWDPPREYLAGNVSGTIAKIVSGYRKS